MEGIKFDINVSSDPRENKCVVTTEDGMLDLTPFIRAIQVYAAHGEMAVVGVEFIQAKVEMTGDAVLTSLAQQADPGSAAQAVKALDPHKIEARALEGLGMGDNMTEALIAEIVKELEGDG